MIRPAAASSFAYHPELDGLRAFAMVAIVFFHAGAAGWSNSFISLDLFFVLSGFLVAHVVLAEVDATGRVSLSRFYARRVRRLLPAAIVAILLTCVLLVLTYSLADRLDYIRQAQAALLYVANWQFVVEAHDYFAADAHSSPFMHYWSLSVEEQYYILFPLVVIACVKLAPRRRTPLLVVLGVLFLLSLTSQAITGQVDPERAYFATDARAFQLLAGAILALAVREYARSLDDDGAVHWPRLGAVLATVGVVGYLVLGSELIAMSNSVRSIVATAFAGAMVVGMYAAPRAVLTRVASHRLPVYLGSITYGTYLWHWPLVLLFGTYLTVRPSVVAVLALVLSTAIASLSSEVLESPIRRARSLNRFGWSVVATGLALSVASAVLVVGPVLSSDRTPSVLLADTADDRAAGVAESGRLRRELDRRVPEVDVRAVRGSGGPDRTSCAPDRPEDCLLVDGSGPHVVLVGDSHARMYGSALAALARDHGFKLSMSSTAGCAFQAGLFSTRSQDKMAECREARAGFYERTLPRMEPDVVVLASAARGAPGLHGGVVTADGRTGDPAPLLAEATRRTLRLVHRAGADAVIFKITASTEGWGADGFDPLDCLSRAERLRACAVTLPSSRPPDDAIYEALAVEDDRAVAVDTLPVYCPDAPVCAPMLDGRVVWRNADHLSADLVRHRRAELWEVLRGTGFLGG